MHRRHTALEITPGPSPRAGTAADRAFARFCASGDPADLAEVFDRTAPRLLLVAMHLARDTTDAEDLLQTTFVEAMRGASKFEPGRPVLPWLLTILARRAHNHRRSRTRRRAERLLPASLPSPEHGPGDRAAEREVIDRVAAAVEELEEPFREVLALRLVHGLAPIEIARALGRPAGTVHAQLHRGMLRLRARLPRGLALPAALLLGTGEGLAAVRAQVLRAAPSATAAGAVVGGGASVKYLTGLGAALAGLTLLLVWSGQLGTGPATMENAAPGSRALTTSSSQAGSGIDADAVVGIPRSGGEPARTAEPPLVDDESCVVTGRVVAGETGEPLAGASVRLWGYSSLGRDGVVPPSWEDPAPQITGADGRFSLAFVPLPRLGISLEIARPGRVPVRGGWIDLRPGALLPQGDVPLLPGTPVVLRAEDAEGNPVAGLPVRIDVPRSDLKALYPGALRPRSHGGIRHTDEDGALPPVLLFPRTWQVIAGSATGDSGYLQIGPRSFEVAPNEQSKTVTVRVERPDPEATIAGRILDEEGLPVGGLVLYANVGSGHYTTRSSADGSFFFPAIGSPGDSFPLSLSHHVRSLELLEPRMPVPVGTRDLVVLVQRHAETTIRLSVADAETGTPIEEYRYRLVPCTDWADDTVILESTRMPPAERHPNGRVDIAAWPGSHLLFVRAEDAGYAMEAGRRIDVSPAISRVDVVVRLRRRMPWSARVVDESGDPVAGSHVALLRRIGIGEMSLEDTVYTTERAFDLGAGGDGVTLVTSSATTDGDGLAALSSAPLLGTAALRVTGDLHAPRQVPIPAPPVGAPFEVVVRGAGVLEGRVTPFEFLAAWGPTEEQRESWSKRTEGEERLDSYRPHVIAVDADDPGAEAARAVVADDGSFRIGSLPPGTWRLQLAFTVRHENGSSMEVELPAATVGDLRAGEVRRVEIDAARLVPGRVRGRVFVNGAAWSQGELRLRNERSSMWVEPAPDGSFTTEKTVPGAYGASLAYEDESGRPRLLTGDMDVRIEPGRTTRQDLHFTRRRLVVRLLDAEGQPAADRHLSLQIHGDHPLNRYATMLETRRTESDGRVTFEPAPAGGIDVIVWDRRPRNPAEARDALEAGNGPHLPFTRLGPVVVPAGRAESEVELRLR